jgi:hypothetical protein
MAELQQTLDFDKMRKKVPADRLANAIAMEAASRVMNRQVFDRLKQIATGQGNAPAEEETTEGSDQPQPEENAQTETVDTAAAAPSETEPSSEEAPGE